MRTRISSSQLENYIRNILRRNEEIKLPRDTSYKIAKLSKIGGGLSSVIYTFTLIYYKNSELKEIEFVLKVYRGNEKVKCMRESEILRALKSKNFPVPRVYAVETSNKFLGRPFILMEKVKGKPMGKYLRQLPHEKRFSIIKRFAEMLVFLHSLKWRDLELSHLRKPIDEYDYAKFQAASVRTLQKNLNVKLASDQIVDWIQHNASAHPCYQYSIIHGDMHLDNFLITKDEKIVSIDWEYPEIGDPLKDVALAYQNLLFAFGTRRQTEGKDIAEFFIREYAKNSKRKIDISKFRFYMISSASVEAICYRFNCKQALNPLFVSQNLGIKYLLAFPLLSWHFWWRSKILERLIMEELKRYNLSIGGFIHEE